VRLARVARPRNLCRITHFQDPGLTGDRTGRVGLLGERKAACSADIRRSRQSGIRGAGRPRVAIAVPAQSGPASHTWPGDEDICHNCRGRNPRDDHIEETLGGPNRRRQGDRETREDVFEGRVHLGINRCVGVLQLDLPLRQLRTGRKGEGVSAARGIAPGCSGRRWRGQSKTAFGSILRGSFPGN